MEKNRYFQYLAGERTGEVLIFDRVEKEDDMVFVCFKDGSRCNEDLILPINERVWNNKLMAEVEDSKNIWEFKTEYVGAQKEKWSKPEDSPDGVVHLVQPEILGRKKVTPIPPRKSKSVFGQIEQSHTESNIISNNSNSVQAPTPSDPLAAFKSDPVWIMMEKAKKFETDIEMNITISLPSKSLYEVARESFEEGGKKVVEYIIANIDDEKIKNSLKNALYTTYEGKITGTDMFVPEELEAPIVKNIETSEENKEE